jgi:8-oxo-dGTP pyrophosphatase MutT (NUDIX family)
MSSPRAPDPPSTVAAAGAIVWRRGLLGSRVAVVRRTRHEQETGREEWTLPKGHRDAGETLEEAARREGEEETGWRVVLGSPAGVISYSIAGRAGAAHPEDAGAIRKTVRFWHARAVAPRPPAPSGDDEVTEVAWLRPRQAVARLTYREQADLLARGRGWAPRDPFARWPGAARSRRRRFEQARAIYAAQIDPAAAGYPPATRARIDALLASADTAFGRGDVNGAWEALFAAQEQEVLVWDEDRVDTRAEELLAEVDFKFAGHWRGIAARELLAWARTPPTGRERAAPSLEQKRHRLSDALRLRNERAANLYRDLDHLREQLVILGGLGLLVCIALTALVLAGQIPVDVKGEPTADQILGAALFGALGGSFSGAISLILAQPRRIPQGLAAGWTTMLRPVVGAAGGLAAFAFLAAGVLGIDGAQAAYAVAFAAGFSERLVSKAAESLTA